MPDRRKQFDARCPSFTDRLRLRLSRARCVDGLLIGASGGDDESLHRVEAALQIIKTCDPLRYRRLLRDLDRVWVRVLPGPLAQFSYSVRACELDERFVLADSSRPDVIAAAIVHEATHARLWRSGIHYREEVRERVEAACLRRELAFAAKLPDGNAVRERAESAFKTSPRYWTNAAFSERYVHGAIQALRYLGTPEWLIRTVLAARALRIGVSVFVRRLASR